MISSNFSYSELGFTIRLEFTGDPLHSRALAHSRAPLFTQPCPHCSHSRAPGEQWARLCVFTLQGCVQTARLCRGSPVEFKCDEIFIFNKSSRKSLIAWSDIFLVLTYFGGSCFLAATKQLYKWYFPSVCPSVRHTFFTMFPSSYHHEIFRSYYHGQKWCPCKRSRSEVKGQGHRGQHPTSPFPDSNSSLN